MKKRGVYAALFFACKTAFASRLAPTFDRVPSVGMRLPVGASLLAKGATQTPNSIVWQQHPATLLPLIFS